jgi:polysaccharide pyruvyl transferase WcaK-like protein
VRGVPALAIGYQPKTRGIMAGLGLETQAFDIGRVRAADLSAAAEEILASPADFRERVRPRLAAMKEEVAAKLGRALGLAGAGTRP